VCLLGPVCAVYMECRFDSVDNYRNEQTEEGAERHDPAGWGQRGQLDEGLQRPSQRERKRYRSSSLGCPDSVVSPASAVRLPEDLRVDKLAR
jgi:hypothetical protein